MKTLIYEYAPHESIIGRLISDRKKIIVLSTAKGIFQHDGYTWEIEDDHFVHMDNYTAKSDKIAKVTNTVLKDVNIESRQVFVNTLFDLLDKVNITEFRDDAYNIALVKGALSSIRIEWKNTPKEDRKVILKVLFTVLLIAIKR